MMLLKLEDGREYTAHFLHRKVGKKRTERWTTSCVFHADKCKNPDCAKLVGGPGSFGVAICNPGDQFSKARGRIESLTRAMNSYGPTSGRYLAPLRSQIWAAYFKISPHR